MLRVSIVAAKILSVALCALAILVATAAAGTGSFWETILRSTPATGERSLGPANAQVVVIEYASTTCSHCAMFHIHSWPQIKRNYVDTGRVRWIIRELPLDSLAMAAFMLARCMPADQYFATIDILFSAQKSWTGEEPRKALWMLMKDRMSHEQFESCLTREDLSESIYKTAKRAVEEFGVKSTPTFFVNGEKIAGAQTFDYFKTLLDRALRKAAP